MAIVATFRSITTEIDLISKSNVICDLIRKALNLRDNIIDSLVPKAIQ